MSKLRPPLLSSLLPRRRESKAITVHLLSRTEEKKVERGHEKTLFQTCLLAFYRQRAALREKEAPGQRGGDPGGEAAG